MYPLLKWNSFHQTKHTAFLKRKVRLLLTVDVWIQCYKTVTPLGMKSPHAWKVSNQVAQTWVISPFEVHLAPFCSKYQTRARSSLDLCCCTMSSTGDLKSINSYHESTTFHCSWWKHVYSTMPLLSILPHSTTLPKLTIWTCFNNHFTLHWHWSVGKQ